MIEPSDTSAAPSREESDLVVPLQSEEEQGKAADKGNSARGSIPPRNAAIPDSEVPALPKRRRFPADYKARIVEEAEACTKPGAIGALLRREGCIRHSYLVGEYSIAQAHSGRFAMTSADAKPRSIRWKMKTKNCASKMSVSRAASSRRRRSSRSKKSGCDAGDSPEQRRERRNEMMDAVKEHAPATGVAPLCRALALSRATAYRTWHRERFPADPKPRPKAARALNDDERQAVLDVLHEERFADQPPAQVYASLLDEERFLCSERTMYRILDAEGEVKERRNQLEHPPYIKPELLAERPNEVWSWDITKLKGPVKWTCFYLYVILDIFSRYTVVWLTVAS